MLRVEGYHIEGIGGSLRWWEIELVFNVISCINVKSRRVSYRILNFKGQHIEKYKNKGYHIKYLFQIGHLVVRKFGLLINLKEVIVYLNYLNISLLLEMIHS